jgi:hypothetical protein
MISTVEGTLIEWMNIIAAENLYNNYSYFTRSYLLLGSRY